LVQLSGELLVINLFLIALDEKDTNAFTISSVRSKKVLKHRIDLSNGKNDCALKCFNFSNRILCPSRPKIHSLYF
jgi:hypothetical protein